MFLLHQLAIFQNACDHCFAKNTQILQIKPGLGSQARSLLGARDRYAFDRSWSGLEHWCRGEKQVEREVDDSINLIHSTLASVSAGPTEDRSARSGTEGRAGPESGCTLGGVMRSPSWEVSFLGGLVPK